MAIGTLLTSVEKLGNYHKNITYYYFTHLNLVVLQ